MGANSYGRARFVMLRSIVSIIVCSLAGSAVADVSANDAALIKNAQAHVIYGLTDPDSAHFRDLYVRKDKEHAFVVCGEVNSRNRMGGYDGYQRFIDAWATDSDPSRQVQFEHDPLIGQFFEIGWSERCSPPSPTSPTSMPAH